MRSAKRGNEFTRIPKNVREGKPIPEWPEFIDPPSPEEKKMWDSLWGKPQAELWELNQQELQVAMYVRAFIAAIASNAYASERTSTLRFADSLLLSTHAMLAARVVIVEPTTGELTDKEEIDRLTGAARKASDQQQARARRLRDRVVVLRPDPTAAETDPNESSTADE